MEEKTSICVIGAGLSGLVCAYKLAQAGFRVQVVEQQSTPGGIRMMNGVVHLSLA